MTTTIHIGSAEPAECGADCPDFIRLWLNWSTRLDGRPAAIITVPATESEYLALVGPKTRNLIRKADRTGYTYRTFDYNEELDAMYLVNISKAERQGKPMSDSYRLRPTPILGTDALCEEHRRVWVGAYLGGLVAYCQLILCRELAIINRILGHADALPDGVMDGLMLALVRYCMGNSVRYINYLTLDTTAGLRHFKESVGFRELEIEVVA